MMTLKSLGYQHLLEEEEVHYHVSFATQLQTYGMWEWAVFVLLHIKNVDRFVIYHFRFKYVNIVNELKNENNNNLY